MSDHLPEEELNIIESRCNAARKGPWRFEPANGMDCIWMDVMDGEGHEVFSGETLMHPHICKFPEEAHEKFRKVRADLEFAAHARSDVPALIQEIRRIRKELEYSRIMLTIATKSCNVGLRKQQMSDEHEIHHWECSMFGYSIFDEPGTVYPCDCGAES